MRIPLHLNKRDDLEDDAKDSFRLDLHVTARALMRDKGFRTHRTSKHAKARKQVKLRTELIGERIYG